MLMGTAEVRVPALHQCPGDIGLMAQQLAVEIARDLDHTELPQLDVAAREALRTHRWERNHTELRETVLRMLESSASGKLGQAAVRDAIAGGGEASARSQLESSLSRHREDIICAVGMLLGDDAGKAARFFACDDVNKVRSILK
jgi:DNA-binding NtrC family response regulator